MTKFLLPVLALAATLSLSHPALAEDGDTSPPIIRPAHHTLDGINQEDIYQYLGMVFSKQNEGRFHTLDGKVHKFLKPINIEIIWPLCQNDSENLVHEFSKKTDIRFNYSSGEMTGLRLSMLILGVDGIEDLKRTRFWYAWLSNNGFKGSDDLEEKVRSALNNNFILSKQYFDNFDQIRFVPLILKNNISSNNICSEIIPGMIFTYLANTKVWAENDHLSDLDYLYISALYDDSILPDEPEDSARPKLANLMLNKLERTK